MSRSSPILPYLLAVFCVSRLVSLPTYPPGFPIAGLTLLSPPQAEKISPIPLSKFKTVERRGEQAAQQAKEAEAREAQEEMDAEGNKKEGGFLKRLFSRKS